MSLFRFTYGFLFCLFSIPTWLLGQSDTLELAVVNISSSSTIREKAIGGESKIWLSKTLSAPHTNTLADLLSENGVFIKSYGSNSLATSSIRGGSAGHTLVLWNGLPIQSPMLGLLDLSLLPLNSADEISFQAGGSSALWGSGAIGGVIGMNNKPTFNKQISLNSQSQIGSFGAFQQALNLRIGKARFESVTKVTHKQAENNFHYPIAPGFPDRQQTNARFSQQNFTQDFYFLTKSKHRFSLHFWQQFSQREIPPTNVQLVSKAHQNDRASRLLLQWQKAHKNALLKGKIGYFKEDLDFFNEASGLEARSHFQTLIGDFNSEWSLSNRQRLLLGFTQAYTSAQADGYIEKPEEYKSALFASYQLQPLAQKEWRIQASLRQELVDQQFAPIVPVLAMDFPLFTHLRVKGKVSRNYRLPTMNDRFWVPGGNKDLKAESGWSEELTLIAPFQKEKDKLNFKWTGTIFNRKINNWILWSKQAGQAFWSANNITQVWSRGLEQRAYFSKEIKSFSLSLNLAYDYIRSTNQVALTLPRIAEGEQLIYTPKHQASINFSIQRQGIHFSYKHLFTGASQGVNEALPAYQTGNLRIQYSLVRNRWNSTFLFNINNIWDNDYFVVDRRPMPGISFQGGVKIAINGQKESKTKR